MVLNQVFTTMLKKKIPTERPTNSLDEFGSLRTNSEEHTFDHARV
jgi:hypothetical protein